MNEKRLNYEQYKDNFDIFIETIINFISEKIKEKKTANIIEITKEYLINNFDLLLEKAKIPKDLFLIEFKLDNQKFIKYLINLISPEIRFLLKIYSKNIFEKLESILIEVFSQFK